MLAKLVPFLMLPIVTRLMPGTEYFGLSDLSNTVVSFAQAVAIMGMYDAMFRMFFEENDNLDYKKTVCSTALFFVFGSSLVISICMFLLQDPISRIFFGSSEYAILVVISAVSVFLGGNNSIIQAPTRMQNKRLVFIIMNLVTAILSYCISIPMLLLGEYLVALPIAALLTSLISLSIFGILNRSWFSIKLFDTTKLKEMLIIGIPLMPTFLFYWIFNSADRLMIINMLGAGAAGIYAIAAKVGQVSQLIYTAFAQGWQYFAFSTMKDDDQVELTSRIYEYLGVISFVATGLLIVILNPLYDLLFPAEYDSGIVCVPYLFLAPLLLMLYQVAGNQLLVIRKTWPSFFMLLLGVIVNLVLNYFLIPNLDIEGAAIATICGYVVTNLAAIIILSRMNLVHIRKRFLLSCGVLIVFFVFWRLAVFENLIALLIGFLLLITIYVTLYYIEIKALIYKLKVYEH